MTDLKHLTTVKAIREAISEARDTIRCSVLHRASIDKKLLRMQACERDQYEALSALYIRHREVCKHPSRALSEHVVFGRQVVHCNWCHKNISSEKV